MAYIQVDLVFLGVCVRQGAIVISGAEAMDKLVQDPRLFCGF